MLHKSLRRPQVASGSAARPNVQAVKPVQPLRNRVRVNALSEAAALEEAAAALGPLVDALPASAALVEAVGVEAGILAGAGVIAGIAGSVAWALSQGKPTRPEKPESEKEAEPEAPPPPPRENAVLVLGASGRVGRRVVQRLIAAGKTVVAAARTAETAKAQLAEAGLQEGFQPSGKGILFFEGVDVTSVDSLKRAELWKGVQQVVAVVGAKAGPLPGGGFGYIDGLTPEVVEAGGLSNLVSVLPEVLPKQATPVFKTVLPMGNAEEVAFWERMDDVIMGGQSESAFEAAPELGASISRWRGDLILEGGGFCGQRTKALEPQDGDLSAYDGIFLRVKGDGQIFKLNIKTVDQLDKPESTYQATFDTVDGQWSDVYLPWHNFVPVKRAQSDPDGAPVDPSKIAKFGIVLSRFEFNKMPNPIYKAGTFELLIDGGFKAYKAVRPQIVQISSAGVERNAIIGDDAERRKADIPIVQLNPGATLNHKYAAELAIRASGYPYAVVRSTGMIDSAEGGPYLLEADQGDIITGSVSRDEVADVIVAALTSPEAAYKTFEVRRSEAIDGRGRAMNAADYTRMFLRLALDRNRWRVGLRPFPKYAPPPAPVTEERKQEILTDVEKVRAAQKSAMEAKVAADVLEEDGKTEVREGEKARREKVGASGSA